MFVPAMKASEVYHFCLHILRKGMPIALGTGSVAILPLLHAIHGRPQRLPGLSLVLECPPLKLVEPRSGISTEKIRALAL